MSEISIMTLNEEEEGDIEQSSYTKTKNSLKMRINQNNRQMKGIFSTRKEL